MRTRESIEKAIQPVKQGEYETPRLLALLIEVMLDIRDELSVIHRDMPKWDQEF